MSATKREFMRQDAEPLPPLSQYDRLERIAMSHGLHIQRVDGYQVVNARREVVLGTIPMTLDEMDTTISQTLALLDGGRAAAVQRIAKAEPELAHLAAHRAHAARRAWEAEHLGPDGDWVEVDEDSVIPALEYDAKVHGPALIGAEEIARRVINAKVKAGLLERLPGGLVREIKP